MKYFDMIIKYTNDVVNSENQAVKAAKEMEESSLKALFARKNMVNVNLFKENHIDFRKSATYRQDLNCGK